MYDIGPLKLAVPSLKQWYNVLQVAIAEALKAILSNSVWDLGAWRS